MGSPTETLAAWVEANTTATWNEWKAKKCPGTWAKFLADKMRAHGAAAGVGELPAAAPDPEPGPSPSPTPPFPTRQTHSPDGTAQEPTDADELAYALEVVVWADGQQQHKVVAWARDVVASVASHLRASPSVGDRSEPPPNWEWYEGTGVHAGTRYCTPTVPKLADIERAWEYHDAAVASDGEPAGAPRVGEAPGERANEWTDEEHWRAMSQDGRSEILHQTAKHARAEPVPHPVTRVGMDTTWPVYRVLQILADATGVLLHEYGYDRHGHEVVLTAMRAADCYVRGEQPTDEELARISAEGDPQPDAAEPVLPDAARRVLQVAAEYVDAMGDCNYSDGGDDLFCDNEDCSYCDLARVVTQYDAKGDPPKAPGLPVVQPVVTCPSCGEACDVYPAEVFEEGDTAKGCTASVMCSKGHDFEAWLLNPEGGPDNA